MTGRQAPMTRLLVASYGGGVQSTAMLAPAAKGRLHLPVFLFANTGDDSEYPDTLHYVRTVAAPYARAHGIALHELHRIRRDGRVETLYGRLTREGSRSLPIPVRMSNGAPGARACTADLKIAVLGRWLKAHGASAEHPAAVAVGISLDKWHRAQPPGQPVRARGLPTVGPTPGPLRLHAGHPRGGPARAGQECLLLLSISVTGRLR